MFSLKNLARKGLKLWKIYFTSEQYQNKRRSEISVYIVYQIWYRFVINNQRSSPYCFVLVNVLNFTYYEFQIHHILMNFCVTVILGYHYSVAAKKNIY